MPAPEDQAAINNSESEPNPNPVIQGGNSSDPQTPKRYAMFAWKTRYIVTDSDVNQLLAEPQYAGKYSENTVSLEKPQEPEPEYTEEDKDVLMLEKAGFPTIYTITKNKYTDNKPIVTWGILHSTQFAGL